MRTERTMLHGGDPKEKICAEPSSESTCFSHFLSSSSHHSIDHVRRACSAGAFTSRPAADYNLWRDIKRTPCARFVLWLLSPKMESHHSRNETLHRLKWIEYLPFTISTLTLRSLLGLIQDFQDFHMKMNAYGMRYVYWAFDLDLDLYTDYTDLAGVGVKWNGMEWIVL